MAVSFELSKYVCLLSARWLAASAGPKFAFFFFDQRRRNRRELLSTQLMAAGPGQIGSRKPRNMVYPPRRKNQFPCQTEINHWFWAGHCAVPPNGPDARLNGRVYHKTDSYAYATTPLMNCTLGRCVGPTPISAAAAAIVIGLEAECGRRMDSEICNWFMLLKSGLHHLGTGRANDLRVKYS